MRQTVVKTVRMVIIFMSAALVTGLLPNGRACAEGPASRTEASPAAISHGAALVPVPAAVADARAGKHGSEVEPLSDDENDDQTPARDEKPADAQSFLDEALELVQTAHEDWVDGDNEHALEALDQAYGFVVRADAGSDPKLEQQKEDLRFTISKRILEIYASRVRTVKGTHKAIPLTINKYVEREITLLTGKELDFFLAAYQRSGRYRGGIVKALREAGLPEELSWLPLIESGFKVRALSRTRALGLWQFMPSTGYKFGLKRTNWIDQRLSPAKSTAAAITYLKELHGMFGDWATVLAAYNCGEGTVLRAISRQKREYLDNFWDLYEKLPYETARYFPRFLAVLAILKNPARYNIVLPQQDEPEQFETVTVQKQVDLRTFAEKAGVPFEELAALNPDLRRRVTPPTAYALKIPAGSATIVLTSLDSVPAWSGPKNSYAFHRVRRGENLTRLALRYHTSVRAIVESNHLGTTRVHAGQRLKIPARDMSL